LLKAQHLKVVSAPCRFGAIDSSFAKIANAFFGAESYFAWGCFEFFLFYPHPQ
jgi:hypothetical protein